MATRAVGDVGSASETSIGSASEMSNIYSDASGGKGVNIDSESDTEVTIFGFSDEETDFLGFSSDENELGDSDTSQAFLLSITFQMSPHTPSSYE